MGKLRREEREEERRFRVYEVATRGFHAGPRAEKGTIMRSKALPGGPQEEM